MPEHRDLRRLHLVQQLGTLPRELVDKIFNDLTLFKILQLATWADPVITAYILDHKHYGKVFLSTKHLGGAALRFTLWRDVKIACGWRNDRHMFALNPMSSLFAGATYNAFMNDMIQDIEEGHRRATVYMPLLSQYSPEPLSPGLARTESHMKPQLQKIWAAQESIKKLESQQLKTLAGFLETFPDMLRSAHDPRGDASTVPPEHNIKMLRGYSKKVFNTEYMRLRRPVHCKCVFRNGILPIVPRNWCLQLLLESDLPVEVTAWEAANLLAARPVARQGRRGEVELKDAVQSVAASTVDDSATSQRTKLEEATDTLQHTSLASSLPSHGTNDLHTAIRGLRHMYARPDHMMDRTPIARISTSDLFDIRDWFSRSCEERKLIVEHRRPHFLVPSRSEFSRRAENVAIKEDNLRARWKRGKAKEILSVQPYHPQEVEWLGAFLRSIALLRKNEEQLH